MYCDIAKECQAFWLQTSSVMFNGRPPQQDAGYRNIAKVIAALWQTGQWRTLG
jgi:hypothetical protein